MFLDPGLAGGGLLALCWGLFAAGLLLAVRRAPWRQLRTAPRRIHLVAGGALACLVLWLLNIRAIDGLVLHLLGVTTLTLVVGWSLAVLAATASLLAFALVTDVSVAGLPLAWLFSVALPASVSYLLVRALYRPGLGNPFFYIWGAGFAGGALVVLLDALLALALFAFLGLERWISNALDLWPLIFLVMFSEAFINGMCIAALAIFHPDAVKTFDDRFYLGER